VTSRPTRITLPVERQPVDEGLFADFVDDDKAQCGSPGHDHFCGLSELSGLISAG
jgi:hypothetical protein